jgi:hypothetical protein
VWGASHRHRAAATRLNDAYPNAQMAHLLVHATWLSQIQVYFSVASCADPSGKADRP